MFDCLLHIPIEQIYGIVLVPESGLHQAGGAQIFFTFLPHEHVKRQWHSVFQTVLAEGGYEITFAYSSKDGMVVRVVFAVKSSKSLPGDEHGHAIAKLLADVFRWKPKKVNHFIPVMRISKPPEFAIFLAHISFQRLPNCFSSTNPLDIGGTFARFTTDTLRVGSFMRQLSSLAEFMGKADRDSLLNRHNTRGFPISAPKQDGLPWSPHRLVNAVSCIYQVRPGSVKVLDAMLESFCEKFPCRMEAKECSHGRYGMTVVVAFIPETPQPFDDLSHAVDLTTKEIKFARLMSIVPLDQDPKSPLFQAILARAHPMPSLERDQLCVDLCTAGLHVYREPAERPPTPPTPRSPSRFNMEADGQGFDWSEPSSPSLPSKSPTSLSLARNKSPHLFRSTPASQEEPQSPSLPAIKVERFPSPPPEPASPSLPAIKVERFPSPPPEPASPSLPAIKGGRSPSPQPEDPMLSWAYVPTSPSGSIGESASRSPVTDPILKGLAEEALQYVYKRCEPGSGEEEYLFEGLLLDTPRWLRNTFFDYSHVSPDTAGNVFYNMKVDMYFAYKNPLHECAHCIADTTDALGEMFCKNVYRFDHMYGQTCKARQVVEGIMPFVKTMQALPQNTPEELEKAGSKRASTVQLYRPGKAKAVDRAALHPMIESMPDDNKLKEAYRSLKLAHNTMHLMWPESPPDVDWDTISDALEIIHVHLTNACDMLGEIVEMYMD